MTEYLAHSARDGFPAQSYTEHVHNVTDDARSNAVAVAQYAKAYGKLLICSVYNAALFHDLGKLHAENQNVLHKTDYRGALPIHHQDAGVARLKELPNSLFSQIAICSHHNPGLPDMPRERTRKNNTYFRDEDSDTRAKVNNELPILLKQHEELVAEGSFEVDSESLGKVDSIFYRILISCLADADHTDTARHYKKYPLEDSMPELRAKERLANLDAYVQKLQSGSSDSERNDLRREMYETCRDSLFRENIVVCDSPVGSGKTTAVMAHLLRRAMKTGARRIFVVLPFTNIIEQSVDVYRKALTLPGEDPESVVAELHHRADYESEDLRALSSNWKSPIIVTTAVAFFETLASNRPAVLRKLHELPGSVIFVDEAHAAVPVKLLPVTWRWITELADAWSCFWVLASGSLVRFWEIGALGTDGRNVPQLISNDLRSRLGLFENRRIEYKFRQERLTVEELTDWVSSCPGPRLVIMNTVKNAAVVADKLLKKSGADGVLHISTALKSEDRKRTIDKVKEWLKDDSRTDWTLVATSCVEAGVDFSFKTGFREVGSLLSLLQAAGRINRNGEGKNAVIWSFQMRDDEPMLVSNPTINDSAEILTNYFNDNRTISPELCTDAIARELRRNTNADKAKDIVKLERDLWFKKVNGEYRVIDSDSVLALVDEDLKQSVLHGGCDWKEIQKRTVAISKYKIKDYCLEELGEGIYFWSLRYDSFLGVMRGVLDLDGGACFFE